MSLSDCPKCWDTPCSCGYEYKDYEKEASVKLILAVVAYCIDDLALEVLEEAVKRVKERNR